MLRRLDCVLAFTKGAVLDRVERLRGKVDTIEPVLCSITGHSFYNTSPLDLRQVLDDPGQVVGNLQGYVARFSPRARDILEKPGLDAQVVCLARFNLLFLVPAVPGACCSWCSPSPWRSASLGLRRPAS